MMAIPVPRSFATWLLLIGITSAEGLIDLSFERAYWTDKPASWAATHVRKALLRWKPSPPAKRPSCTSALDSVDGFWVGASDPATGCIHLKQQAPGRYAVAFMADGHEGGWHMRRTATLRTGILELSGPLLDYELPPYGRIYALAVGKERWLVPDTALQDVAKLIEQHGCESLPWGVPSGLLYAPADSRAEEYCRWMFRASPPKQ